MNQPMLNYDRENDILYLVIREGEESHFGEAADGVIIEFDRDNQPIGIEILNAARVLASAIGRERLTQAAN